MQNEYRGIEYLRRKLNAKAIRVKKRYRFYEMKYQVRDLGISTPPKLRALSNPLGWCSRAVDGIADRLIFREFRNDVLGMNEIYQRNNPDVLFDSAGLSALIAACSFLYISRDEDGYPRIQVIDGANATGVIDDTTNLLKEGYAILQKDDSGKPLMEAWLTAEDTQYYYQGKLYRTDRHVAGHPLLVPVIYRPDASRPFGHSCISRSCMGLVEAAVRTVKRAEISAEFYSFPQRWATGLAQDYEMDKWQAAMTSFLTVTKDEDGENGVQFGQFAQQSMAPHNEQLRSLAATFAGETGLTLDDLGFASENPTSAEAIKAKHDDLRLRARKAQRTFGTGFLNAGFLAASLRDDYTYRREAIYMTKPMWEPIFEPDASSIGLIGDGLIKLNQAVPGFATKETLRDITGIEPGV